MPHPTLSATIICWSSQSLHKEKQQRRPHIIIQIISNKKKHPTIHQIIAYTDHVYSSTTKMRSAQSKTLSVGRQVIITEQPTTSPPLTDKEREKREGMAK